MELVDLLLRGDAAGGGDAPVVAFVTARMAAMLGPAHESFGVHVGVEKLVAERLEGADRVDGRERQRGFPAVNHDVAAATIHGRNDALASDRLGECAGELEVRRAVLEERRSGDDLLRARFQHQSRARSTERMPPPTRQASDRAIHCTRSRLFAGSHRRVQVDHLHLRELLELPDPPERRAGP